MSNATNNRNVEVDVERLGNGQYRGVIRNAAGEVLKATRTVASLVAANRALVRLVA